MLMGAFARLIIRRRRLVAVAWLLILAASLAGIGHVTGRLNQQITLPGQPGYVTNQRIQNEYGNGGNSAPLVPVITLPSGRTVTSPGVRAELARAFAAVSARVPAARVVSYASDGDRSFAGKDGRTTFGLVFVRGIAPLDGAPPALLATITTAVRAALPGATVQVSGLPALRAAHGGGGSGVLAETLLGALGALLVLALVFGSLLAIVPLLVAGVSILATFLLVLALTTITDVSFLVQYLIALIGLGVAVDYSLLFVTRWREERARGRDDASAVEAAMCRAGQAILISGLTVGVGLASLIVLPVPFLRSLGYGGMLIPLVSVAVTLTLLPVLLAAIGPRIDRPRPRRAQHASRLWTGWAGFTIRHRLPAAAVGLAALAALGAAGAGIMVGQPRSAALSQSGPAYQGLHTLRAAGIPTGVLTPIEVLTPAPGPLIALRARLDVLPGVYDVSAPADPAWQRDRTALAVVLPSSETSTTAGQNTIVAVRRQAARVGPAAGVGGIGVQDMDFIHAVYGTFPVMLGLIALVTWLLLARLLRSILLPLKAVMLNLISVGATYGVLVLVWQDGYGSRPVWGIPATGAITNFIPLMVFAFLFGLSMDYEVFILTRIRESYDATGSTSRAITEGLGYTGRLVTSAALILFLAFAALASGPETDIKVFATGLGAGILIDATVVRMLLVPALMSLLGRWNWWFPAWAARLLLARPAPEPRPGAPEPARFPTISG
jgi:RND superfamily putative drug exporter